MERNSLGVMTKPTANCSIELQLVVQQDLALWKEIELDWLLPHSIHNAVGKTTSCCIAVGRSSDICKVEQKEC